MGLRVRMSTLLVGSASLEANKMLRFKSTGCDAQL